MQGQIWTAVASGMPANFTGGRSWNMKSHFHRSEGFDACSHVRRGQRTCECELREAGITLAQCARGLLAGERGGEISAHGGAARIGHRRPECAPEIDEDLPVLLCFARRP